MFTVSKRATSFGLLYHHQALFLQKHFNDFKHGNGCSKFAQHLLENRHSIGPIDEIMEILHIIKEGKMMDTLE